MPQRCRCYRDGLTSIYFTGELCCFQARNLQCADYRQQPDCYCQPLWNPRGFGFLYRYAESRDINWRLGFSITLAFFDFHWIWVPDHIENILSWSCIRSRRLCTLRMSRGLMKG